MEQRTRSLPVQFDHLVLGVSQSAMVREAEGFSRQSDGKETGHHHEILLNGVI